MNRFIMTGTMLAIFVVMVAVASTYPPGARFMPFVVGFPAIALCLLQLMLDLRDSRREVAAPAPMATPAPSLPGEQPMTISMNAGMELPVFTPEVRRKEMIVWGYILALIGGILVFGFYITVPIFLVSFMRFYAEASWRLAILLPAFVSVFLYVMLTQVFRMTLHLGFITEYVMDRIGG